MDRRVTAHPPLSANHYLDAKYVWAAYSSGGSAALRADENGEPQSHNRGQVPDASLARILVNRRHHGLSAAAATQCSDVIDIPDVDSVTYTSQRYPCGHVALSDSMNLGEKSPGDSGITDLLSNMGMIEPVIAFTFTRMEISDQTAHNTYSIFHKRARGLCMLQWLLRAVVLQPTWWCLFNLCYLLLAAPDTKQLLDEKRVVRRGYECWGIVP
jgi:hypothetical protein